MPSSVALSVSVPPEMVTLPSEVVSGFSVSPVSGDALTASPPAVMLSVPPVMFSSSSQDRPSFAALMFSLTSATVITASAAPLMPFFALPSTVSVPVPLMASAAPLLTLTAAFSSLEPSVSATVLVVPAAAIRDASAVLFRVIAALSSLVSVRPFSTMVTPVTPFLTVIEPLSQSPENT